MRHLRGVEIIPVKWHDHTANVPTGAPTWRTTDPRLRHAVQVDLVFLAAPRLVEDLGARPMSVICDGEATLVQLIVDSPTWSPVLARVEQHLPLKLVARRDGWLPIQAWSAKDHGSNPPATGRQALHTRTRFGSERCCGECMPECGKRMARLRADSKVDEKTMKQTISAPRGSKKNQKHELIKVSTILQGRPSLPNKTKAGRVRARLSGARTQQRRLPQRREEKHDAVSTAN